MAWPGGLTDPLRPSNWPLGRRKGLAWSDHSCPSRPTTFKTRIETKISRQSHRPPSSSSRSSSRSSSIPIRESPVSEIRAYREGRVPPRAPPTGFIPVGANVERKRPRRHPRSTYFTTGTSPAGSPESQIGASEQLHRINQHARLHNRPGLSAAPLEAIMRIAASIRRLIDTRLLVVVILGTSTFAVDGFLRVVRNCRRKGMQHGIQDAWPNGS